MANRAVIGRTELLERRLAEKGVLVADGGMGTSLFELGLESGSCPELWNIDRADVIADVHRKFVEAGAEIILTNTFGGNRERLALHNAAHRVAEVNGTAAEIANTVAQDAQQPVVVAGSVGPTGALLEPLGPLTLDDAVDIFAEQIEALAAAGVDVVWIETMSSLEELGAAVAAALLGELPIITTMSFDTNGHTMMGVSPSKLADWWDQTAGSPIAVGANCGLGPGEAILAAGEIAASEPVWAVVAKGNCGIPRFEGTQLHYPADPAVMDEYAQLALDAGARIVGACCGSRPEHIQRIRRVVDSYESGAPPTRDDVAARVGLETAGSQDRISPLNPNAKRARRRRRA